MMIPSNLISGNIFSLGAKTEGYTWSDLLRGTVLRERETTKSSDVWNTILEIRRPKSVAFPPYKIFIKLWDGMSMMN